MGFLFVVCVVGGVCCGVLLVGFGCGVVGFGCGLVGVCVCVGCGGCCVVGGGGISGRSRGTDV